MDKKISLKIHRIWSSYYNYETKKRAAKIRALLSGLQWLIRQSIFIHRYPDLAELVMLYTAPPNPLKDVAFKVEGEKHIVTVELK